MKCDYRIVLLRGGNLIYKDENIDVISVKLKWPWFNSLPEWYRRNNEIEKSGISLVDKSEKLIPGDIRSVGKRIMGIALGVAIRPSDEGKCPKQSEETSIYPS